MVAKAIGETHRAKFTIANLMTETSLLTPAEANTAITIPYCKAVLNGKSGWFAEKPAVMMTFDGGKFLLYGCVPFNSFF